MVLRIMKVVVIILVMANGKMVEAKTITVIRIEIIRVERTTIKGKIKITTKANRVISLKSLIRVCLLVLYSVTQIF